MDKPNTFLLDTNAYGALLSGAEYIVEAIAGADTLYIPYIVLGELYAGFYHGAKFRENIAVLNRLLSYPYIKPLNLSAHTFELYGLIFAKLRQKGRMIPQNDIWIAALAIESGSTLITLDSHFLYVEGLYLLEP